MNVLILSDLVVYSGVGQYIVQLGEAIADNYKNTVVLASSNIQRTDISENIIVIKLPAPNKFVLYLKLLHKIIDIYKIDVVHFNHRKQGFIMRLYQLIYGNIPTVWTCHTVPYPNNLIKRLLGYYGHISIAISIEAQNWMHKELLINNSRIDKITNGVDNSALTIPDVEKHILKQNFFKKYFNEDIDGKYIKIIVAHGRLHPIKGLDLLIKAFAQLDKTKRQNVKLVLSGSTQDAYYNVLTSLIAEYHLDNSVYFTDWVSSGDILSVADLMVQPSLREGFPLAVMEAFFMKVPVIRSMVGGFEDVKNFCIGVPVGDVNAISMELNRWLINPNLYQNIIQKAYEFAIQDGTIKSMANKTLKTYNKAIELCQS